MLPGKHWGPADFYAAAGVAAGVPFVVLALVFLALPSLGPYGGFAGFLPILLTPFCFAVAGATALQPRRVRRAAVAEREHHVGQSIASWTVLFLASTVALIVLVVRLWF